MFKLINRIMILLCYLPYLYLLTYYSYVVRAIIKLRRIPTYDNPDPKELGFSTHRYIIYKLADIVIYGLCLFILLLLITLFLKKFTIRKMHWKLLLIGIIIFILIFFIDPFMVWFAD